MTDPLELLGPAVIERAMSIFESFKERAHSEIVQARKALTPRVFELIEAGETDEQRLVVSALTYLKSLEARNGPNEP
jgi:NAD dependent epimerase/dehydratase family enzyme